MKQDIEKIYNMYFKDLYRFLLSLTHGDSNLSEELTQETFFKAIKNINSFEGKSKLYTWLCQIAKNTYFNYLKTEKRYVTDHDFERSASDEDIAASLEQEERVEDVLGEIDKLEEPYLSVIKARLCDELSFKEIAQNYKKSESWARVTYHRAKNKVKEALS